MGVSGLARVIGSSRLGAFVARVAYAACGSLAFAASGCSKLDLGVDEPKTIPFEVQITITSDPGQALPGALIMAGTKVVERRTGETGPRGCGSAGKRGIRSSSR